jgi:hypothetical protein
MENKTQTRNFVSQDAPVVESKIDSVALSYPVDKCQSPGVHSKVGAVGISSSDCTVAFGASSKIDEVLSVCPLTDAEFLNTGFLLTTPEFLKKLEDPDLKTLITHWNHIHRNWCFKPQDLMFVYRKTLHWLSEQNAQEEFYCVHSMMKSSSTTKNFLETYFDEGYEGYMYNLMLAISRVHSRLCHDTSYSRNTMEIKLLALINVWADEQDFDDVLIYDVRLESPKNSPTLSYATCDLLPSMTVEEELFPLESLKPMEMIASEVLQELVLDSAAATDQEVHSDVMLFGAKQMIDLYESCDVEHEVPPVELKKIVRSAKKTAMKKIGYTPKELIPTDDELEQCFKDLGFTHSHMVKTVKVLTKKHVNRTKKKMKRDLDREMRQAKSRVISEFERRNLNFYSQMFGYKTTQKKIDDATDQVNLASSKLDTIASNILESNLIGKLSNMFDKTTDVATTAQEITSTIQTDGLYKVLLGESPLNTLTNAATLQFDQIFLIVIDLIQCLRERTMSRYVETALRFTAYFKLTSSLAQKFVSLCTTLYESLNEVKTEGQNQSVFFDAQAENVTFHSQFGIETGLTVALTAASAVSLLLFSTIPPKSELQSYVFGLSSTALLVTRLASGTDKISNFITWCKESLKDVICWCLGKTRAELNLLSVTDENKDKVLTWAKSVEENESESKKLEMLFDYELQEKVLKNKDTAIELVTGPMVRASQSGELIGTIKHFSKLAHEHAQIVESTKLQLSAKVDPYCFCLYGQSNVGKSTVLQPMCESLAESQQWPIANRTYCWNPDLKFMDGYSCQKIITCDDFSQFTDGEEEKHFFGFKSPTALICNMADLNAKGRPFRSLVIAMATNVAYPNAPTIKKPAALHRRRDDLIAAFLKQEFCDDGEVDHQYDYSHLLFSVVSPTAKLSDADMCELPKFSLSEISKYINERAYTHLLNKCTLLNSNSEYPKSAIPKLVTLPLRKRGDLTGLVESHEPFVPLTMEQTPPLPRLVRNPQFRAQMCDDEEEPCASHQVPFTIPKIHDLPTVINDIYTHTPHGVGYDGFYYEYEYLDWYSDFGHTNIEPPTIYAHTAHGFSTLTQSQQIHLLEFYHATRPRNIFKDYFKTLSRHFIESKKILTEKINEILKDYARELTILSLLFACFTLYKAYKLFTDNYNPHADERIVYEFEIDQTALRRLMERDPERFWTVMQVVFQGTDVYEHLKKLLVLDAIKYREFLKDENIKPGKDLIFTSEFSTSGDIKTLKKRPTLMRSEFTTSGQDTVKKTRPMVLRSEGKAKVADPLAYQAFINQLLKDNKDLCGLIIHAFDDTPLETQLREMYPSFFFKAEGSLDVNSTELTRNKLSNSVIFINKGGINIHATALKGTQYMVNRHFADICKDGDKLNVLCRGKTFEVYYSSKDLVHLDSFILPSTGKQIKTDVIIWNAGGDNSPLPSAPDITGNLIRDSDLDKIHQNTGTLLTVNRTTGAAITNYCQNINLEKSFAYNNADGQPIEYGFYRGCTYDLNTLPGDCGGPVIIHNPAIQGKVLGIHCAGADSKNVGACVIVTQEMIKAMNLKSQACGIPVPQHVNDDLCENRFLPSGHVLYVGKCLPTQVIHQTTKTDIVPSVTSGVYPVTSGPSVLSASDPRQESGEPPLAQMLDNYYYMPPWKPDDLDIVNDHCRMLERSLCTASTYKGILTEHEAINGHPKLIHNKKMNMNTSPGFPYTMLRPPGSKGKAYLFSQDPISLDYTVSDPLLRHRLDERLRLAKLGQRIDSEWVYSLKDELRPLDKVKTGKSRVFCIASVDYTIFFRQYFMSYLDFLRANRNVLAHAVEVDPTGTDWTEMYNWLMQLRPGTFTLEELQLLDILEPDENRRKDLLKVLAYWMCCDHKAFDQHERAEELRSCCGDANAWYDDGEINALIRRVIIDEAIFTNIRILNIILTTLNQLPSGFPATVDFNIKINRKYSKLVWRIAMAQAKRYDIIDLSFFMKYVRAFYTGDDTVKSIAQCVVLHYNNKVYKDIMESYGHSITAWDKSQNIALWDDPAKTNYLKRGFSPDPRYPSIIRAPITTGVIEQLCNFIRKTPDEVQACRENLENSFREAYFHGREYFEQHRSIINTRLRELRILEISLNYDDLDSVYLRKFFSWP